jgi:lipopolysaccharide/colanic/teichoic acid biosynthesis glycosyltransferase
MVFKPGLTGSAQIQGTTGNTPEIKLWYGIGYI